MVLPACREDMAWELGTKCENMFIKPLKDETYLNNCQLKNSVPFLNENLRFLSYKNQLMLFKDLIIVYSKAIRNP
jgi:hypothetical protein